MGFAVAAAVAAANKPPEQADSLAILFPGIFDEFLDVPDRRF